MSRMIRKLSRWLDKNHRYRQTVRELGALTDKELQDIGISRCDIQAIAWNRGRY